MGMSTTVISFSNIQEIKTILFNSFDKNNENFFQKNHLEECDVLPKDFFNNEESSSFSFQKSDLEKPYLSPANEEPLFCEICNKKFFQIEDLKRHYVIHSGETPYSCQKKSYVSSVRSSFPFKKCNREKPYLSRVNEEPLFCNVCNKKFIRNGDLKRHYVIHTGEKPFSCEECGKRFTRSMDKKRHLVIHTGEKPFTCDICNKKFYRKDVFKTHSMMHSTERPYACEMCDKKFYQSGDLKRHCIVHTKEKPYSCHICNKSYTRKSDLTKHFFVHSKEIIERDCSNSLNL